MSTLKRNALDIWLEIQGLYPNIFEIVITSVPAESFFSKVGATITHNGTRLSTWKNDHPLINLCFKKSASIMINVRFHYENIDNIYIAYRKRMP